MTVTAEQVREVAEALRDNDLPSVADSLDIFAKKLLPVPDPNIGLAQTLVNAYFEGPAHVTQEWLQVAAAAREALTPSEPRYFREGDAEPEDITYVYDESGDLFKRIERDRWAMKLLANGTFGSPNWRWNDINAGGGATEVFGDLG